MSQLPALDPAQKPARTWLALTAAVIALLMAYCLAHFTKPPMPEMFAWGICFMLSLFGYGHTLLRACLPGYKPPVSLTCVVGASACVAFGGVVTATRLMSTTVAILTVALGVLLATRPASVLLQQALARLRRRLGYARRFPLLAVCSIMAATLILCAYAHGAATIALNAYDDELAYMTFPKQMLQTGTFTDPFSLRRVAAYGGQSFLHALLIAGGNLEYLSILDRGVFFALSLLCLRDLRFNNRRPPFLVVLATMFTLLILQNTSINTASNYSGLVGFIALYQLQKVGEATLGSTPASSFAALRLAVVYALVGSFLCTLRQNFVPVVALAFGVHIIGTALRSRQWRQVLITASATAGLALLALLGWIIQIRESSGTALFPLVPGMLRPAFTMRSPTMTTADEVRFYWEALCWHEPFPGWPAALLAIPLIARLRRDLPLAGLAVAGLAGHAFLVHSFTLSNAENFARYTFPFVAAALFIATLALITSMAREHADGTGRWPGGPGLRAILPYVLAAALPAALLLAQSREFFRWTSHTLSTHLTATNWRGEVADRYGRAQLNVPTGATILVMVDEPYNFNYARNTIYNLDIPGAISPAPSLPFFGPYEDVETYLAGQKIRYLAFVRPASSRGNYIRRYWFNRFFHEDEIWRRHAPYYVYMFDALEDIASRHSRIFEEAGLVVVDLQQPAALGK